MITLDGVDYNVRINYETMQRNFEIVQGKNAGTSLSGRAIQDILGTSYSYTVVIEQNPAYLSDYERFYYAVTAPVETHRVSFPFDGDVLEFDCRIVSGRDVYMGDMSSSQRWKNLQLSFIPVKPQRTV